MVKVWGLYLQKTVFKQRNECFVPVPQVVEFQPYFCLDKASFYATSGWKVWGEVLLWLLFCLRGCLHDPDPLAMSLHLACWFTWTRPFGNIHTQAKVLFMNLTLWPCLYTWHVGLHEPDPMAYPYTIHGAFHEPDPLAISKDLPWSFARNCCLCSDM